ALKELKARGASRVTIIARDFEYGGMCVNFACMPSEFFWAHLERCDGNPDVGGFVEALRRVTREQFKGLGYPILEDEVVSIEGNHLLLKSGATVVYDRVVLATGGQNTSGHDAGVRSFWSLSKGRLLIFGHGHPALLSLADMAMERG